MEVRYRNDLYGNYMLISIPDEESSNKYSFKMLDKNRIPGVLSGKERKEDGKGYWYVDISKKKTLVQEYQEKEMQLEDMIDIFQELIPILEELRNYLLNESMVVLDPEYIFRDLDDQKLYILILPWNREEKNLQKLAEFFLEKVNHRDENGVNAAYLFYRQQNQQYFSLYHFLPVLEKESILKRQKGKENEISQSGKPDLKNDFFKEQEEKNIEKSLADDFDSKEYVKDSEDRGNGKFSIVVLVFSLLCLAVGILPIMSSMIRMSCLAFSILLFVIFLSTIIRKGKHKKPVLKEDYNELISIPKMDIGTKETIFFDSFENDNYLKLQWKERGRKKQFVLKDFPCIVGKMQKDTNLCIADVSVSRIHCRFVEQNNKVCIMDLNSTNGTFLNGLPLKSGEVLEIEKNDEILIGKVKVNVV